MSLKYSTTTADYLVWSDAMNLIRKLAKDKNYSIIARWLLPNAILVKTRRDFENLWLSDFLNLMRATFFEEKSFYRPCSNFVATLLLSTKTLAKILNPIICKVFLALLKPFNYICHKLPIFTVHCETQSRHYPSAHLQLYKTRTWKTHNLYSE